MLFLILVLPAWFLLGTLIRFAFPFKSAISLIASSFRGKLDQEVKYQWHELLKSKLLASVKNKKETKRLNELESKHWLLIKIFKLLSEKLTEPEQIDRLIEELEKRRNIILGELKPLKRKYYRQLAEVQNSIQSATKSKTEKIEEIIGGLITDYSNLAPSDPVIQSLIETLNKESKRNPSLRVLRELRQLLDWISHKTIAIDQSYEQTIINYNPPQDSIRARKNRDKYHFKRNCNHYPKAETLEDEVNIIRFPNQKAAEEAGFKACEICSLKKDFQ